MKTDIHPDYNTDVKVKCSCGNTFVTGSTIPEIDIELCSNCHPFYTGKQKLVDTAKRVDKFQARVEKSKEVAKTRKGKKVKKAEADAKKAEKAADEQPAKKPAAKKPAAKKESAK